MKYSLRRALVVDMTLDALLGINPTPGDRTVVSDAASDAGISLARARDIATLATIPILTFLH